MASAVQCASSYADRILSVALRPSSLVPVARPQPSVPSERYDEDGDCGCNAQRYTLASRMMNPLPSFSTVPSDVGGHSHGSCELFSMSTHANEKRDD